MSLDNPKSIAAEKVSRDNSDVWKHSKLLFLELRKENYSKSDPAAYVMYCEAAGLEGYSDPYDDLDLRMDLDKFKESLSPIDTQIFSLMLLGLKQKEIEEVVGLSQAWVSVRLKNIRKMFKSFYNS